MFYFLIAVASEADILKLTFWFVAIPGGLEITPGVQIDFNGDVMKRELIVCVLPAIMFVCVCTVYPCELRFWAVPHWCARRSTPRFSDSSSSRQPHYGRCYLSRLGSDRLVSSRAAFERFAEHRRQSLTTDGGEYETNKKRGRFDVDHFRGRSVRGLLEEAISRAL